MIQFYSLKILFLMLVFSVNFTGYSYSQKIKNKDMVIIPQGQSRSYMLTNNNAAFYFSETGSGNISAFQGLNVQTHEFLEDYIIEINGTVLTRESGEAHLYPNKLIRKYNKIDLDEEITLMDSLPVLIIKLNSTKKMPIAIVPFISGASQSRNYITYWTEEDKLLYIAKKNHMVRSEKENYPVWTGVCTFPDAEFLETDSDIKRSYVDFEKEKSFLPGKLNFFLDKVAYIFIIVGDNKEDVLKKRKNVLKQFNIYIEKSNKKIKGVRKT